MHRHTETPELKITEISRISIGFEKLIIFTSLFNRDKNKITQIV